MFPRVSAIFSSRSSAVFGNPSQQPSVTWSWFGQQSPCEIPTATQAGYMASAQDVDSISLYTMKISYEALHSITDSKSHYGMSVWHKGIVRKYPEKPLKGEELVRRFGQLLLLQLAMFHYVTLIPLCLAQSRKCCHSHQLIQEVPTVPLQSLLLPLHPARCPECSAWPCRPLETCLGHLSDDFQTSNKFKQPPHWDIAQWLMQPGFQHPRNWANPSNLLDKTSMKRGSLHLKPNNSHA